MSRRLLMSTLLVLATAVCWGQTTDDPLHGYCDVGCVDNGTNSPTSGNPITGFGFTISPGGPATGTDFLIEVLVPNDEQTATSYAITGTSAATATLFSATDWTGGFLDTYLGLTANPNNPIGNYLSSTHVYDPTATGFSVYQADLGAITLQGASNPGVEPLLNIDALPIGSFIVAFFKRDGVDRYVATANSGAIFETSNVPEPTSIILFGTVALFAVRVAKRAQKRQ